MRPARLVAVACFTIVAGCDPTELPSRDGGTRDAGPRDSGLRDSGPIDAGATDAGRPPAWRCDPNDGRCIFRHETFGDEQLWTDVLRLNELVEGLPPTTALAVGLKVDSSAVPPEVLASADLTSPATTVALLSLDAVVGVDAEVREGRVVSIGVTCALCHSDVDDSVMPGIGLRRDGWPNRDLDAGRIIALTPGFATYATRLGADVETARAALNSWGPGRYDARFNQDGMSHPVVIPAAYGLRDVALETYTGEGEISYWNAYVAVTQMGARGTFVDPRIGVDVRHDPDLLTPLLPALRDYQFSLEPPAPGPFDATLAARGRELFEGKARCSSCHEGNSFTDAPELYTAAELGMDPREAERSRTGRYRTTPLRGVAHRPPFFHDGSAATLGDVVDHYVRVLQLELTSAERAELVEYLRSL